MEKGVMVKPQVYDLGQVIRYSKLFEVDGRFFLLEFEQSFEREVLEALDGQQPRKTERLSLGYEPTKPVQFIFKNNCEIYRDQAMPLEIKDGKIQRPQGKGAVHVGELEEAVVDCLREHAPPEVQEAMKRYIGGYAQNGNGL